MVSTSKLFQTHSMYLTGVKLKRGRDQSKRPMNTGLLDICTWTRSEAVGFVITDIPPLSRTSGLRRTVRCVKSPPYVRITFSYSNLHDMTNSTIEICQVGLRPPGWRVTLHLYVRQYVQVWGKRLPHAAFSSGIG